MTFYTSARMYWWAKTVRSFTRMASPSHNKIWGQFWVNNYAHVLTGKDTSNEMLLCFLELAELAPHFTGAVHPKLNLKNFARTPFCAHEAVVSRVFAKEICTGYFQVWFNSDAPDPLSQTRDLLLLQLIFGEICVSDADEPIQVAS